MNIDINIAKYFKNLTELNNLCIIKILRTSSEIIKPNLYPDGCPEYMKENSGIHIAREQALFSLLVEKYPAIKNNLIGSNIYNGKSIK